MKFIIGAGIWKQVEVFGIFNICFSLFRSLLGNILYNKYMLAWEIVQKVRIA